MPAEEYIIFSQYSQQEVGRCCAVSCAQAVNNYRYRVDGCDEAGLNDLYYALPAKEVRKAFYNTEFKQKISDIEEMWKKHGLLK